MRLNVLIDKTGTFLNAGQNQFIAASAINGSAAYSLFFNQITLEFFDEVTTSGSIIVPVNSSVVRSGLSGTRERSVWSSVNSRSRSALNNSAVDGASATIDVSTSCMLQWTGITQALDVVCTGISGANYINLLIDRN